MISSTKTTIETTKIVHFEDCNFIEIEIIKPAGAIGKT